MRPRRKWRAQGYGRSTRRIAQITRSNTEANFGLALRLAESKDLGQALEIQADHTRKQVELFARQLEEIRDLATKIIQESASRGSSV